jgi:hypothetical protein
MCRLVHRHGVNCVVDWKSAGCQPNQKGPGCIWLTVREIGLSVSVSMKLVYTCVYALARADAGLADVHNTHVHRMLDRG